MPTRTGSVAFRSVTDGRSLVRWRGSVGPVSFPGPDGTFGTHDGTTYPPAVYSGDGETSAVHRPDGSPPDFTAPSGTRIEYLATGASTNGLFGLYKYWMPGTPVQGPAPHFHRTMTESFYVLQGQLNIYDGTRWVECTPGDWVHVPVGGVHGFRNESGEPVQMLLHFSPGAPREEYFEQVPFAAQLDDEERAEFYLRHDNHWL
jgi:mannose-6-phosphate isomerase-like protein (cupin superfamily)